MLVLLKIILVFLPWKIKRYFLNKFFKYDLHKDAYIGVSWVYPKKLHMNKGSVIDHFNVAIHIDKIELGFEAAIGRGNWITGFPSGTDSKHFIHQFDRVPELYLGDHSSITKNHHLDCTNTINIGKFSIIAGYNSQLLTHSIDIVENRQDSFPIIIGDYTYIGTNTIILGGAFLPSYSVLGAKSLLNKRFNKERYLYAGVPAKPIKELSKESKFFSRESGYVF